MTTITYGPESALTVATRLGISAIDERAARLALSVRAALGMPAA